MKTKFFLAAAVASVLAVIAGGNLHAQQRPAASPAPGGVAVVDISYIFKYHARFKVMMDGMKKEVEGRGELQERAGSHRRQERAAQDLQARQPGLQEARRGSDPRGRRLPAQSGLEEEGVHGARGEDLLHRLSRSE